MAKLDMTVEISSETNELAWELQQEKPDTHRIKWLLDDMHADLPGAIKQAHLDERKLLKNPLLRPLQLQKHLHH